jgi:hypothetical protein
MVKGPYALRLPVEKIVLYNRPAYASSFHRQ